MRFGPLPVADAEGAILAHAVEVGGRRLRKAVRLGPGDIAALLAAGIGEVVAARLEAGDVGEDEAAARLADALQPAGIEIRPVATGRANLHARHAGVFRADRGLVDGVNAVDPALTLATLPDHAAVAAGQMVATVKIIPFAVPASALEQGVAAARAGQALRVDPFRPLRVGLVQTTLPAVKASVLDKTVRITTARLARSGSRVVGERRPPHETQAVAEAVAALMPDSDLVVVFGASAVSDDADVVPAAIKAAGGAVLRAGMPVDPGNLLVLGTLAGKPVLGAPGCARSVKENGFDWVLDRLTAGIPVSAEDIAGMGVGGLLMEIPSRPQPRDTVRAPRSPTVHAVVLAAGRSSRMGGPNKLLAQFGGEPLIRRTVGCALASRAAGTVVVVGHQADRVAAALFGLAVTIADNPDYGSGLAASLKTGVAALPADADAALVVLGDMPDIAAADLDRLIAAFVASGGTAVVRATHDGRRGNPVILPRAVFAAVAQLEGDTGARHIVEAGETAVVDVEIGAAAAVDVDTPEALRLAGGVLEDGH